MSKQLDLKKIELESKEDKKFNKSRRNSNMLPVINRKQFKYSIGDKEQYSDSKMRIKT